MVSRYHAVGGLRKGLLVLRALGRLGEATSARVANVTDLPRPTVHRLLETLRAEGYVYRKSLREPYRLALMVNTLTENYRESDWLVEVAEPVLSRLRAEVVWPTDVATYENGYMVIRLTTHASSPLSIERVARGRTLDMLISATGRAYLAFCPTAERAAILELLATMPGVLRPPLLEREIAATRDRGYGLRIRSFQPKTSTIAVPVMHGETVLACINISWIDSALEPQTAVDRYLKPLRAAAADIGLEYAKRVRRR